MKLGIYHHFKGKQYKVVMIAKHSETLEEMVLYHPVDDEKDLWVRPKKMFLEKVEVDGKFMPRFIFQKNNNQGVSRNKPL